MPYNALLKEKIQKSGLSINEIASRCNIQGTNITAAYISTIKNNPDRIPSDEISKALAQALGINDRLLIIEAFADKAPEEFISFVNTIRSLIIDSIVLTFENTFTVEQLNALRDNMNTLPISEFILQMKDYPLDGFNKSKNSIKTETYIDDEKIHMMAELTEPSSYEVKDDSMFPTMPNGSKATLEILPLSDYKNGNILYIQRGNKYFFRKCYFTDEKRDMISLIAMNQSFDMEIVNINEITIIGKVKRLISSLE